MRSLCFALLVPVSAYAATFNVNSTVDAVDASPGNGVCATAAAECTLRAAIQEANALAGADTINVPAGTYTLTITGINEQSAATGDLDIRSDMTITGAGASTTIVQAHASSALSGIDRVFEILTLPTVTIQGLKVRYGNAGAGSGGGISTHGNVTISQCVITDNRAASNDAGGIYANSGGSVALLSSSVSNNTAVAGGGITITPGVAFSADNSTISGNVATASGGGLRADGNGVSINISDSTISGNSASEGTALQIGANDNQAMTANLTNCTISGNSGNGGVIAVRSGIPVHLVNCTIANNASGLSLSGSETTLLNTIIANTTANNCGATLPTSNGYNLSDDTSCSSALNQTGDQNNVNPLLGALTVNAPGSTATHALLGGSPAIDAGTATGAPSADQRGVSRPQGSAHDIGAYEFEKALVPGSLTFVNPFVVVNEIDGTLMIDVGRANGSDGSVDVTWTITPGSAAAGQDFTGPLTGTLTFPDGITTQTISIPIVNDDVYEEPENFSIVLSNATGGAAVGPLGTVLVTINSEDSADVPTASEWGLILLGAMLALFAVARLR